MKQLKLTDDLGAELRDKGILTALNHANNVVSCWGDKAYGVLLKYLEINKDIDVFQIDDIRLWARENNLIEDPPDNRAWGSIPIKACKNGLITKIGVSAVNNPLQHKGFAALWGRVKKDEG